MKEIDRSNFVFFMIVSIYISLLMRICNFSLTRSGHLKEWGIRNFAKNIFVIFLLHHNRTIKKNCVLTSKKYKPYQEQFLWMI